VVTATIKFSDNFAVIVQVFPDFYYIYDFRGSYTKIYTKALRVKELFLKE